MHADKKSMEMSFFICVHLRLSVATNSFCNTADTIGGFLFHPLAQHLQPAVQQSS